MKAIDLYSQTIKLLHAGYPPVLSHGNEPLQGPPLTTEGAIRGAISQGFGLDGAAISNDRVPCIVCRPRDEAAGRRVLAIVKKHIGACLVCNGPSWVFLVPLRADERIEKSTTTLSDGTEIEVRGAGCMTVVLNDAYVWEDGRFISSVQPSDLAPLNNATLEKIFAEAAEIPATNGAHEPAKSNGWTPLEPDAEQLQSFVNALFCGPVTALLAFAHLRTMAVMRCFASAPRPLRAG